MLNVVPNLQILCYFYYICLLIVEVLAAVLTVEQLFLLLLQLIVAYKITLLVKKQMSRPVSLNSMPVFPLLSVNLLNLFNLSRLNLAITESRSTTSLSRAFVEQFFLQA